MKEKKQIKTFFAKDLVNGVVFYHSTIQTISIPVSEKVNEKLKCNCALNFVPRNLFSIRMAAIMAGSNDAVEKLLEVWFVVGGVGELLLVQL